MAVLDVNKKKIGLMLMSPCPSIAARARTRSHAHLPARVGACTARTWFRLLSLRPVPRDAVVFSVRAVAHGHMVPERWNDSNEGTCCTFQRARCCAWYAGAAGGLIAHSRAHGGGTECCGVHGLWQPQTGLMACIHIRYRHYGVRRNNGIATKHPRAKSCQQALPQRKRK